MAINLLSMTIEFIDCEADGIRRCHINGESLLTVVVPRNKLSDAKALPDIPKRGIYFLLDEDHGVLNRVYAGQTTKGLLRLDDHKSSKDFWNKAVMFLDTEYVIDRDVLDALEATIIEYVESHGDYETDNKSIPCCSPNPYKEQQVNKLHKDILFRMEALGYDLSRTYNGPEVGSIIFHTKKNGIDASGRYDKNTGKFIVLAGSQVDLNKPIIKNQGAIASRREIFGEEGGCVILKGDAEFPSPSAAAVFVLGGSQNGWVEWLDESGKTLSEIYRVEKN